MYYGSDGRSDKYYDRYTPPRRRRRGQRRRGPGCCSGCLTRLLFRILEFIVVFCLICAIILYAIPPSVCQYSKGNADLSVTRGLGSEYANVLLLGIDFTEEAQRSDCMIIASFGYRKLKLTSIMRDTIVSIPGHGNGKINSAYTYGGPELAMQVVNETLGMNITRYIVIDFATMVDLVDAVGGIDIELSDRDISQINGCAIHTLKVIWKQNPEKYEHYRSSQKITRTGWTHLNGLFATGYTRIRYSDSDYVRTSRQREVIRAILTSIRSAWYNPLMYSRLSRVLFSLNTNLSMPEMLILGEKVLIDPEVKSYRVPETADLSDNGSSIRVTNPTGMRTKLKNFIYS